MRSYARNQGSQATAGTILADIANNESTEVSENTIYSYIKALKKIFVIEDSTAWKPDDLINDLSTFGLFFETLCVRDLRVYADALGGSVYHFRDKNGLECDAVVHLRNGKYGLIEVKLGGDKLIEEGARNLVTWKVKSIPIR